VKTRAMIRHPLLAASLGAAVVALPASALYLYGSGHIAKAAGTPAIVASVPAPSAAPVATGLPDFRQLVQTYGPAVVNISVRSTVKTAGHGRVPPGMDEDNPLFQFMPHGNGAPLRGEGSGFIVSADGIILTNAHVVDGAQKVTVKLTDRREFEASVIGSDAKSDVAVLKIDAHDLPVTKLGDPRKLQVGEWVVAIGSPFGLENTVTAGIVSAKQRDTGDYLPFIQTDVAINPGNSGGPLINMRGEVVGINSQIYSRSGGFMGISFAIPIDEAIRVSEQLRVSGRVSRGRIGVQIDQVTRDVAESIGLGKAQGALVRSVESGSPADKAGVEAGDIITKFDGKLIDRATDLPRLVGNTKPGTRSTMTVFRRGGSKDLAVTIAEFEPEKPVRRTADKDDKPKGSPAAQSIGLSVSELTDAQRKELKLKGGVKVDTVTDAAARAGIHEGDIIVAIGNAEVNTVKDFDAVVAKVDKSKPIPVLLRRGELATYLLIRPAR